MVALGLARRQRAAKLRRLQKQELEKRATARLGAADGAVYVAAVSRFPGAGQPLGRGEAWSSTRASSEVPAPPAPAPASLWPARGPWLDSRTASRRPPREIARSKAAGVLAAVVVVALGFHGAVARLRDAPHLAAPDEARFDAYGRSLELRGHVGEPDFNTADDSTDSDEEEFDVLDDPSSESSDSDFYD
ncbi:hypothetical protein JL720_16014 [Aureococcus anophagefferens]|nr:hypothetical protein JL720_16014 [Aureococcus anophagefferens]